MIAARKLCHHLNYFAPTEILGCEFHDALLFGSPLDLAYSPCGREKRRELLIVPCIFCFVVALSCPACRCAGTSPGWCCTIAAALWPELQGCVLEVAAAWRVCKSTNTFHMANSSMPLGSMLPNCQATPNVQPVSLTHRVRRQPAGQAWHVLAFLCLGYEEGHLVFTQSLWATTSSC